MPKKIQTNETRILRVVRGLQQLQRTTIPASPLGKAVDKALKVLLEAQAKSALTVSAAPPALALADGASLTGPGTLDITRQAG